MEKLVKLSSFESFKVKYVFLQEAIQFPNCLGKIQPQYSKLYIYISKKIFHFSFNIK